MNTKSVWVVVESDIYNSEVLSARVFSKASSATKLKRRIIKETLGDSIVKIFKTSLTKGS